MNKDLLLKLANFLENHITDDQFDMEAFRSNGARGVRFNSHTDCGTIGCALGWLPFITEVPRDCVGPDGLLWDKFSKLALGLEASDIYWSYIFSEQWRKCPIGNTRSGTAARIREVANDKIGKDRAKELVDKVRRT